PLEKGLLAHQEVGDLGIIVGFDFFDTAKSHCVLAKNGSSYQEFKRDFPVHHAPGMRKRMARRRSSTAKAGVCQPSIFSLASTSSSCMSDQGMRVVEHQRDTMWPRR